MGIGGLPNRAYINDFPNDPFILGFSHHLELHNMLFLHSEARPSLEEQLYLFMKRFRTQPSEFFGLSRDLRLSLYFRELDMVKAEYKRIQEMEAKNK